MSTHLKSVFVLLCISPYLTAFAQVGTLNAVHQPLSPNAATLGKFVEIPVGNFTGTPEIHIPIYELKTKDFTVPISLSYHASGIKVAEVPGWVGAGFLLGAGGAIVRVVRDLPDGIDASGWHDLTNPSFKGQIEYNQQNPTYWPDARRNKDIFSEVGFSKIDMQFDDFYYNFMGVTGSFMFNNQGIATLKVAGNLKIEYASEHFKITDQNGIVYEFNQYETQSYDPHFYISTWYLTKATNTFKNEVVEFKYDGFGLIQPYRTTYGPQSYFTQVIEDNQSPTVPNGITNPGCENDGAGPDGLNELNGDNLFLKQIIYKSDTISFYPSMTSRTDVYKVQLDSIKVRSGNAVVHKTVFRYTYSDTLTTDPLKKKMLLKSLTINDRPPFLFDYYGSYLGTNMPGILTDGADTWGYFNGESSPFLANGKRVLQRYDIIFSNDILYGRNSSYRNPDWRYAQIGSLKSLTYPTGGKSEFEYEGNEYTTSIINHTGILKLDSLRTTGSESDRWVGAYMPILHANEVTIHDDQTVTINTSIGLSPDVTDVATYRTHVYNKATDYQSGKVRLYKFNNATGVFDLLESRTFNPVSTVGNPANDAAFYAVQASGTSAENHARFLTAGRYKVETEVRTLGIKASLTFDNKFKYGESAMEYNIGGLRIRKIKFTSPVNSSFFEKNYDYTFNTYTSGQLQIPYACMSTWVYWGEYRNLNINGQPHSNVGAQLCTYLKVHHDNVIPIGNGQGGPIGYQKVTETMNDGRKKVMFFTTMQDEYMGDNRPQFVLKDNSAFRGNLKSVDYYDSGNRKLKREVHSFITTFKPATIVPYFKVAVVMKSSIVPSTAYSQAHADWSTYTFKQQKFVPSVDSVYYFNGADTVKEVTKYTYDNDFYTNPSKIIRINANGDTSSTYSKYPYDYLLSGTPTNNFSKGVKFLQDRNMISQQVESYTEVKPAGGTAKVTQAQLISFKPVLPVPDTVYSLVNTDGLTNFSPATFTLTAATKDSRYQRRRLFNRYDNGNVVEQSNEGDAKEVLVWGYQRRFIVARVLSSDYNTVIALVDTNVINNPPSDAALRTELDKIRTGLAIASPQAKVTSYTFAGAMGMNSSTDPRGETTYYEYDNYGRLKRSKDALSDLTENLWYHYKP